MLFSLLTSLSFMVRVHWSMREQVFREFARARVKRQESQFTHDNRVYSSQVHQCASNHRGWHQMCLNCAHWINPRKSALYQAKQLWPDYISPFDTICRCSSSSLRLQHLWEGGGGRDVVEETIWSWTSCARLPGSRLPGAGSPTTVGWCRWSADMGLVWGNMTRVERCAIT